MGKYVVVDGCILQFQVSSNTACISINPGQLSDKVKCQGKKVYKTLNFTITNYIGGAITDPVPTPISGSIIATSKKNKVEGNKAILEGDSSAAITIVGTSGGNPVPPVVEVVKVQNAGQTKVKAE